jgi:carbonic anhydrase
MEINNTICAFLDQVLSDNYQHMQTIKKDEYKVFAKVQTPRATVVMCSDSRVQTKAITTMDVNDLFVVRNIGNQVINSSGSIEFGIRFLKTPVLLIIGHSGCGAVEAVVNGVDVENGCIERELETIAVDGECLNDAILQNVHRQVKTSMRKFKKIIEEEKLIVIGAVYDFQDTYKKGLGRLIVINVNGEKSPEKIRENYYLKSIKQLTTL